MMMLDIYWALVALLVLFFLFFIAREYVLMKRFPPRHPERGLYVFNMGAFFVAACVLVGVAFFLELRKTPLESMVDTYPYARFDPIASVMAREGVWIYETTDDSNKIKDFFRQYARASGKKFFSDNSSGDLVLLVMKETEKIFVTIREENGTKRIYYSLDGDMRIITLGGENSSERKY